MQLLLIYLYMPLLLVKLNLNTIRAAYKLSVKSKAHTEKLYQLLQTVKKGDTNVFVAYKGAAIALGARSQKGAANKKKQFAQGVELIEFAILKAPENLEIRFVRLTIQQNSPKLLKYNKQRGTDKAFVLSKLKIEKSSSLKKYIVDYILASKHFTEEEKSLFSAS
ncbi:MAG: hypothetical protein JKY08_04660 [Flavobacteriaceae bacterium]|nr:hypothetical protein [Flavobacteriaceae bacterium]